MGVPKNRPYLRTINTVLTRMKDSGIIDKFFRIVDISAIDFIGQFYNILLILIHINGLHDCRSTRNCFRGSGTEASPFRWTDCILGCFSDSVWNNFCHWIFDSPKAKSCSENLKNCINMNVIEHGWTCKLCLLDNNKVVVVLQLLSCFQLPIKQIMLLAFSQPLWRHRKNERGASYTEYMEKARIPVLITVFCRTFKSNWRNTLLKLYFAAYFEWITWEGPLFEMQV